jgi:ribosomal protein S18 acetylase RimI-like enzyme
MSATRANAEYSSVVVRPARLNDVEPLGVFFIRAWRESGPGALGFTGATDEAIRTISTVDFLTQRLHSPNIRIVIAEKDRIVLGFASIRATGRREGELSAIVVLESAAGVGLGTKLLRKASEAATKMGLEHLTVKTEAVNQRAIRFYKKNGFTESGKVQEKVGRAKVSLMVLEKRLRRHPHTNMIKAKPSASGTILPRHQF